MKGKPKINYEKKHAFFFLEDNDFYLQNPKYIKKPEDIIGKNSFSFGKRFSDQDYINQFDNQNFTQAKNLVVKILPVKKAPKTLNNLRRQILYIGKLLESEEKKSLDSKLPDRDKTTKLYDQDFNLITKEEVKNITKDWIKDFKDGEALSHHVLLSIGGKEDKNKALSVTKLFLEDTFRSQGYDYFFAAHNDTPNDHFHVIIKKKNNLGKNLRFNKNDTFLLRQKYAQYLEKVGIKRQILARRDQKIIIKKVEEMEEHLKNNNSWYQSKLNKGNQKDFNAYNYKANLTGRIEEEINVLKVKLSLKDIGADNENLLNRLRPNLKKNGLNVTLDSLLAVKQMQAKQMKIDNLEGLIIGAVEKKFKPNKIPKINPWPKKAINPIETPPLQIHHTNSKQKLYVPELSVIEVQEKFRMAIIDYFKDQGIHKNLDHALAQSFLQIGSKVRFGDKDSCEIIWHGEAGHVINYKSGEVLKWGKNKIKHNESYTYREVSKDELEQQQQEKKLLQEKSEAEKKERANKAALKANDLFNQYSSIKEVNSPYLEKKNINDLNIRNIKYHEGKIIIPVADIEGNIQSLQYIDKDSSKKFLKDGQKRGNFFILQDQNKLNKTINQEETIYLTEGFATAATINKAIGNNIIVCFDAGNIENVLLNLAAKFPNKEYVILADNDLWKETNTGRDKAEAIIQKHSGNLNVKMILPQFSLEHKELKPTDFNDLQQISGIEEVKKQILEGLAQKKEMPKIIKEIVPDNQQEQLAINALKELKEKIVNSDDKKIIKNSVDETIKYLQNFNEEYSKKLGDKINNDDIRYSYTQPKKEVKYLNKIEGLKMDGGMKI